MMTPGILRMVTGIFRVRRTMMTNLAVVTTVLGILTYQPPTCNIFATTPVLGILRVVTTMMTNLAVVAVATMMTLAVATTTSMLAIVPMALSPLAVGVATTMEVVHHPASWTTLEGTLRAKQRSTHAVHN
jgi:hypothetical protein